jgi:hypothetical protein
MNDEFELKVKQTNEAMPIQTTRMHKERHGF